MRERQKAKVTRRRSHGAMARRLRRREGGAEVESHRAESGRGKAESGKGKADPPSFCELRRGRPSHEATARQARREARRAKRKVLGAESCWLSDANFARA